MIVRPLDENGDYQPIYSLDQMITGTKAVKQIVELRLTFYEGEWWEDESLGFQVPGFIAENARQGDVNMLAQYIASYISNSEGVRSVEDVEVEYNNRKMTFYCLVRTDEGENEVVEVNVDGLL